MASATLVARIEYLLSMGKTAHQIAGDLLEQGVDKNLAREAFEHLGYAAAVVGDKLVITSVPQNN
jgi:hypothetical protein